MTDWIDIARRWIPKSVRAFVQRIVPLTAMKDRWRRQRNSLAEVVTGDDNQYQSSVRVGILRTRALFHTSYVAACQELGVPFQVIDLAENDWQRDVLESKCGCFLAWPDATLTPWAKMYKDRCDVIENDLSIPVYPGRLERWLYEDKVRTRDWLMAHELPLPRTWVFFEEDAAKEFAEGCELPLVFKTSFGAAATGVEIVRSRRRVFAIIRRAFSRGHVPDGHDLRDRQWRSVLFQRFLPDVCEWRLVRIGESYFGHPKGKLGEFFSGSGSVEWAMPSNRHLDLLHRVTELGGFRSMAVDLFETPDGEVFINELQTVFGASTAVDQMRKDGRPGRMVRKAEGEWIFEFGDYSRNACANERVRDVLGRISAVDQMGTSTESTEGPMV